MNTPTTPLSDIGQIALTVSDVAQAKAFYHGILGLKPLFDAGPNLAFLAAGSVRIMLTAPEGNGVVGKNSVLYFRVSQVEAVHAAAVAAGARTQPGDEPHLVARMPDHQLWIGILRDPDGNLVGLMEEKGKP